MKPCGHIGIFGRSLHRESILTAAILATLPKEPIGIRVIKLLKGEEPFILMTRLLEPVIAIPEDISKESFQKILHDSLRQLPLEPVIDYNAHLTQSCEALKVALKSFQSPPPPADSPQNQWWPMQKKAYPPLKILSRKANSTRARHQKF